jgi:hypothetical protein
MRICSSVTQDTFRASHSNARATRGSLAISAAGGAALQGEVGGGLFGIVRIRARQKVSCGKESRISARISRRPDALRQITWASTAKQAWGRQF